MERDPAQAFRWYADAAADGLPEAQFNVAVMLDSGTGVPRDRAAAAIWYARAALGGNARAQYNLGILFDLGDGIDRNPALARAWLREAGRTLDAARARLEAVEAAADAPLAPPRPLAAAARRTGDAAAAELVWTAPSGPGAVRFLVEIAARRAAGGFEPVAEAVTDLSAVRVAVPGDVPLLWRVSALGAGDYAASPWQRLDGPEGAAPDAGADAATDGPLGRVRFDLPPDDTAALILAAELSASFRVAGLMIADARLDAAPSATRVRYAYPADADLAARIASALPGSVAAERAEIADGRPGLVEIALTGGPAAN